MQRRPLSVKRIFFIFLFLAYPFLTGYTPRIETIGSSEGLTCREVEASKYFQGDHARRRLAARFYGAGAVYVGVVFLMEEPSGIKVYLPLDKEKRAVIFKIANEALRQAEVHSEDDEGQDAIVVWFKQ